MSSVKEKVTDSAFGLTNEKGEGRYLWGGDALIPKSKVISEEVLT
jgi:hypothetical protein